MRAWRWVAVAGLVVAGCSDEDVLDKYPPGTYPCILGNWLQVRADGQWRMNIEGTTLILTEGTKSDLAHAARDLCGLR